MTIPFGSDKKTADELKDYFDGEIIIVPPVEDEKGKISSTRIRQAILDGDVKEVNQLLGTPLPSRGMVVHGNARGRTIGYPTANLVLRDRTYMPADGVYVVDIEVQRQRYRGMASVGKMLPLMEKNHVLKLIFSTFQTIFTVRQSWSTGWTVSAI